MITKITIILIAIMAATSVSAGEAEIMGDFFKNSSEYAKQRNYTAFKTLYCGKPPVSLGKGNYFENKKKKFTNLKLTSRQEGLFDNLQYDYIIYLCSRTKHAKEICMVQPVIRKDDRLCIVNILNAEH